MSLRFKNAAT